MSIQAMSWVFDHSHAEGIDRLVLLSMANNDNDGFCGVSKERIAAEARVSETTVWRSWKTLEALGEIAPVTDVANAPKWWRDIPQRRRPRLWRLVGYLGSRDATAPNNPQPSRSAIPGQSVATEPHVTPGVQDATPAHLWGRDGVAMGSRSCATHPYSPSSPVEIPPEGPSLSSAPQRESVNIAGQVQTLVAGYVHDFRELHNGKSPTRSWVRTAARMSREQLEHGETTDTIARCLAATARENKHPRVLAHVIADYHAQDAS